MDERRKNRRKKSRQRRKEKEPVKASDTKPSTEVRGNTDDKAGGNLKPTSASVLTHAIRAAGILPIAVLISILVTHHFYGSQIPHWFQPIIKEQVAVLTLCAGHAGIIGLWINRTIQHRWSTFALVVAAFATAGAGYRSIGGSLAGHVVVILLFLLLIPAIWAGPISNGLARMWRFAQTRKGIYTILALLWVPLLFYNQWQDEDYIRNWLLIPYGIFLGIIVAVTLVWFLLRLAFRFLPGTWQWIKWKVVSAFKQLASRAKKKRSTTDELRWTRRRRWARKKCPR